YRGWTGLSGKPGAWDCDSCGGVALASGPPVVAGVEAHPGYQPHTGRVPTRVASNYSHRRSPGPFLSLGPRRVTTLRSKFNDCDYHQQLDERETPARLVEAHQTELNVFCPGMGKKTCESVPV